MTRHNGPADAAGSAVGLRCDADPATGVGHLLRCLALAEELLGRGCRVELLGEVATVPWAAGEVRRLGITRHPGPGTPAELVAAARRLRLDAVVVDSYRLDPGCAGALRDGGFVVLAIVDGDPRGQRADLYLDQNLDAEVAEVAVAAGAVRLAGLEYLLLRDSVRRLRPAGPEAAGPEAAGPEAPRVVAFFGGTDPAGAAPVLLELLAATGVPARVTVVTANSGLAGQAAAVRPGAGQRFDVVPPTLELPTLLAGADLAISAAGTSTWELLCLGVCPALVWVAPNQRLGYDRTVARDVAVGLGGVAELRDGGVAADAAVRALRAVLRDPRRRADIAARGRAIVDGAGRVRVADALLARIGRHPS
ncbi:MAG TPA: spore coat protein [Catenuloplanes sp.]